MRLLRPIVVALVLLWLPLQGVAAVTMPFCLHSLGHQGKLGHAGVAHQHALGAHAGHHQPTQPPDGGVAHDCSDRSACHLACAPAVAPAVVLLAPAVIGSELYFPGKSRGLFIPDQPQPPPNSLV